MKMAMTLAITVAAAMAAADAMAARTTVGFSGGAAAQAAETVKVEGRGVGADKTEALKDAYRDAVERAVGLYVDAEQKMQNDELVNDQILTQSNAYIEKYKVVKEGAKPNGLVEVRILADVKKSVLTRKLSDVMPKQTFSLGDEAQNIHSRLVTNEKRNVDAAALLGNVIGGFNPVSQLMKFQLADTKPVFRKGVGGRNRVFFRFKFTVDKAKYYQEFLPSFLKVLDQIAIKPAKNVRLKAVDPVDFAKDVSGRWDIWNQRFLKRTKKYLNGNWEKENEDYNEVVNENGGFGSWDGSFGGDDMEDAIDDGGLYVGGIGFGDGKGTFWSVSRDIAWSSSSQKFTQARHFYPGDEKLLKDGAFCAIVIVKMNATKSSIQAREYALPPECADLVKAWNKKILGHKHSDGGDVKTAYNIIFSDAAGEEISATPVSFRNKALSNMFLGIVPYFSENVGSWFVSPMVHCDAESFERWIGFDIPVDELPKIKSVSVELAE